MAGVMAAIKLQENISKQLSKAAKSVAALEKEFNNLAVAASQAESQAEYNKIIKQMQQIKNEVNSVSKHLGEAEKKSRGFGDGIEQAGEQASFLETKIKGLLTSLAAVFGIKKALALSDQITSIRARIDNMNNGLQTTDQVMNKIMKSANTSRAKFTDTADAVARLGTLAGDAFSNTDEIIRFAELLNKNFVLSGASAQETSAAMYQLSQAMASGRLQGDEFVSIMENAPMLAQQIAAYMGKTNGELKEMSSQGLITADVIKNALFGAAEEIDAKFAQMPMTWAQIGTLASNALLTALQPLLSALSAAAQWVIDHWSQISPILVGAATALGVYVAGLGLYAVAQWIATGAAQAFFTTLLTNPLFRIAAAIGVIVAAIYGWVQAVGGIQAAWQKLKLFLANTWLSLQMAFFNFVHGILNGIDDIIFGFQSIAVAVGAAAGNMKASFLSGLQGLVNGAIDQINALINAVNQIPGVNIAPIALTTFGTEAVEAEAARQASAYADLEAKRAALDESKQGRADKVTQLGNQQKLNTAKYELSRAMGQAMDKAQTTLSGSLSGIGSYDFDSHSGGGGAGGGGGGSGGGAAGRTADNTERIADSVDVAETDLKYLRDIAEREAINRFTTAEIKIDMKNDNYISSDMDIDGVVTRLNDRLNTELATTAERSHR